jgi:hypothetical protein
MTVRLNPGGNTWGNRGHRFGGDSACPGRLETRLLPRGVRGGSGRARPPAIRGMSGAFHACTIVHRCRGRALHRRCAQRRSELPTRRDGAFFARRCRLAGQEPFCEKSGGEPQALSPGAPRCAARGNRSRSPPFARSQLGTPPESTQKGDGGPHPGCATDRECRLIGCRGQVLGRIALMGQDLLRGAVNSVHAKWRGLDCLSGCG